MCEKCDEVEVEIGEVEKGKETKDDSKKVVLTEQDLNAIEEMLLLEEIESRTIYINEGIDSEICQDVVQLIHKFNREDEGLELEERVPIKLYVNSFGGSLYDSSRIRAVVSNSETPVIGYLEGGVAMSAGLLIYLACHYRVASPMSYALYHSLRAPSETATLEEMMNTIKHYEKVQNEIDEFIASQTKIPLKKMKKKRKKNMDWYIHADEMVELGIAQEIMKY